MEIREITMMEEKRGLMGRKTSLRRAKACKSSMATSNSKTAIIYKHSDELLKYCPIGLTGSSNCSSYSCSIVQKKKNIENIKL
jgi:hypothetical protein